MLTTRFAGVLLTALWLSLPAHGLAEDKHAPFRPRPSPAPPPIRFDQQPGPAIGYRSYTPPPAQEMPAPQRAYPHGHRLHAHGPWCPVGVAPHVHSVSVPIWSASFYPHPVRTGQAMLQVLVLAAEGDVYVDNQYLGTVASPQGSAIDVPVLPGRHVVHIMHRGNTYSYAVDVEADLTAVVQANLP